MFEKLKTKRVVIGSRPNLKENISQKVVDSPTSVLDDSTVKLVDCIKYLGVQANNHFAWDGKIKSVQAKVSRSLVSLNSAKKSSPNMFYAN